MEVLKKKFFDVGMHDDEKEIQVVGGVNSSVKSAEFISCDINCRIPGGYKLQLISKFMRSNNKRMPSMRSLRMAVADYCFVENHDGFSML